MALRRQMQFVFKNGEFPITKDGYKFVGGSPVALNSSGAITGNVSETTGIIGVAMHSYDLSDTRDLVTIILPPALFTIDKGSEEYSGMTENELYDPADDATIAPWDTTKTYAVGDLLRPTTVAVSGVTYAVWTNAEYTGFAAGTYLLTYPAQVKGYTGTDGGGTNIVTMDIVVEPIVKQVVIT